MKIIYLVLIFFTVLTGGCGLKERQLELESKQKSINEKEQELMLWEKRLQLKEEELALREKGMDSTLAGSITDSIYYNAAFLGNWNVTMRCTEATCPGSAVGDTKKESWTIGYENNVVIVKAMADNKLERVYTGTFTETGMKLVAEHEPTAPNTRITVTLSQKSGLELEGTRQISREDNCQIVYALTMKKS